MVRGERKLERNYRWDEEERGEDWDAEVPAKKKKRREKLGTEVSPVIPIT